MSALGDILRGAGLRVVDKPVRGRPLPFGPVRGILLHHTAGKAPGDLGVVTRGRADLPGPLSQFYVAPDGTWHVVTEGRANHAGRGTALGLPADTGNRYLLGVEVSAPGTAITGQQYLATITGLAALCRANGWAAGRVVGHKEYAPGRKSDPVNSMTEVRNDVARVLEAGGELPRWPLPWGRFYGHRAGLRGWARLRAVPSGPVVRRVNQLLLNSSSSEFTATTAAAVRSWQAKRSLPITGWVDRRTARRMGVCR